MIYEKEIMLFGLNNYQKVIDEILDDLKCQQVFEIELILSEALINAYVHGNNQDSSKPIYLSYKCNGSTVIFEIKDCGPGYKNVKMPVEIKEECLLNESGRGIFLINSFADNVDLTQNSIIIEKIIN